MKPTVLPFSDDGRSAGLLPATFISLVGSRTRIMWGLYQLRSFPRKRESSSLLYCSPGSPPSRTTSKEGLSLRRLAIRTRADGSGDRLGLVSHPRRDDRAKAARRA